MSADGENALFSAKLLSSFNDLFDDGRPCDAIVYDSKGVKAAGELVQEEADKDPGQAPVPGGQPQPQPMAQPDPIGQKPSPPGQALVPGGQPQPAPQPGPADSKGVKAAGKKKDPFTTPVLFRRKVHAFPWAFSLKEFLEKFGGGIEVNGVVISQPAYYAVVIKEATDSAHVKVRENCVIFYLLVFIVDDWFLHGVVVWDNENNRIEEIDTRVTTLQIEYNYWKDKYLEEKRKKKKKEEEEEEEEEEQKKRIKTLPDIILVPLRVDNPPKPFTSFPPPQKREVPPSYFDSKSSASPMSLCYNVEDFESVDDDDNVSPPPVKRKKNNCPVQNNNGFGTTDDGSESLSCLSSTFSAHNNDPSVVHPTSSTEANVYPGVVLNFLDINATGEPADKHMNQVQVTPVKTQGQPEPPLIMSPNSTPANPFDVLPVNGENGNGSDNLDHFQFNTTGVDKNGENFTRFAGLNSPSLTEEDRFFSPFFDSSDVGDD